MNHSHIFFPDPARSLRPAGPGLWPRWCHCRPGGSEPRAPRGGAGALAEAHGSAHGGLFQVHPGALVSVGRRVGWASVFGFGWLLGFWPGFFWRFFLGGMLWNVEGRSKGHVFFVAEEVVMMMVDDDDD